MSALHVFREGNEWGVTVPDLINAAVKEGRPVRLRWNREGTQWDWPGNEFDTIVMPAITDEMLDDGRWFGEAGDQR